MSSKIVINLVLICYVMLTNGVELRATSMKCNTKSNAKQLTMTNPMPSQQSCEYTIRAFNTKICQLRIDFHYFYLDQPTITPQKPFAHCDDERLTINGIPFDFCGNLNQNHIYVPFDALKLTDEIKLSFRLSPYTMAQWYMTVNQIECNDKALSVKPDERHAPAGCLQYFYEPTGLVQSFNYGREYYGDTQYAICFNKGKKLNANLVLHDITFQMDIADISAAGFDANCLPHTNPGGLTEDYILIPKAVVNGAHQQKASIFCSNTTTGLEITSFARGPFVIEVNTDTKTTANMESGFRFRYKIV